MLITGAKLFFSTSSEYLPIWVAWLVGPILWYGGFISICYWFLKRIFQGRAERSKEKGRSSTALRAVAGATAAPEGPSIQYRCELVRPGVSYHKLALIGVTLALVIAATASLR
jgi:hypothetical protein